MEVPEGAPTVVPPSSHWHGDAGAHPRNLVLAFAFLCSRKARKKTTMQATHRASHQAPFLCRAGCCCYEARAEETPGQRRWGLCVCDGARRLGRPPTPRLPLSFSPCHGSVSGLLPLCVGFGAKFGQRTAELRSGKALRQPPLPELPFEAKRSPWKKAPPFSLRIAALLPWINTFDLKTVGSRIQKFEEILAFSCA